MDAAFQIAQALHDAALDAQGWTTVVPGHTGRKQFTPRYRPQAIKSARELLEQLDAVGLVVDTIPPQQERDPVTVLEFESQVPYLAEMSFLRELNETLSATTDGTSPQVPDPADICFAKLPAVDQLDRLARERRLPELLKHHRLAIYHNRLRNGAPGTTLPVDPDATESHKSMVRLAREIHRAYIHDRFERGETVESNSSLAAWNDLTEDLRLANLEAARQLWTRLESIGLRLVPVEDPTSAVSPEALEPWVETLASLEHMRWVYERIAQGWSWGPGVKQPAALTHPLLLPWRALQQTERDRLREQIRHLQETLQLANLKIIRAPEQIEPDDPALPSLPPLLRLSAWLRVQMT